MATRSRNIYDAAKTGDLEYLRSAREQSIDLSARIKLVGLRCIVQLLQTKLVY